MACETFHNVQIVERFCEFMQRMRTDLPADSQSTSVAQPTDARV